MYLNRHIRNHGQKLAARVKLILQSGITPAKLAMTISMGAAVGMMPVLWGTSLVCALLATAFRLNQAAMQAVNYLCYPLQIALFIPLCSLGQDLFPWGPPVSSALLAGALHGHLGATISLVGWASLRGVGAWLITVAPLALLLHPFLKRLLLKRGEGRLETPAA
jgi:hypothetical protein